jgi:hypothetical protein
MLQVKEWSSCCCVVLPFPSLVSSSRSAVHSSVSSSLLPVRLLSFTCAYAPSLFLKLSLSFFLSLSVLCFPFLSFSLLECDQLDVPRLLGNRSAVSETSDDASTEVCVQRHVDGGIVANNPSAVAVHEAARLWPDQPVTLLLSVGTGAADRQVPTYYPYWCCLVVCVVRVCVCVCVCVCVGVFVYLSYWVIVFYGLGVAFSSLPSVRDYVVALHPPPSSSSLSLSFSSTICSATVL